MSAKSAYFLRPVDLKIRRAEELLRFLQEAIDAWKLNDPFAYKMERSKQGRILRLSFDRFRVDPDFDGWGLFTGEIAHNLRSAIDNLAYALCRLGGDPPKQPRKISFPIFDSRNAFERETVHCLCQMPNEAARLVRAWQPFERSGGASNPLVALVEINNADKHRVPPLSTLHSVRNAPRLTFRHPFGPENLPLFDMTLHAAGAWVSGLMLAELSSETPLDVVQGIWLDVDTQILIGLEPYGIEDRFEPYPEVLELILKSTSELVDSFRPLFDLH